MTRLIAACLILLATLPARAHEPMTPQRMAEIVAALDEDAQG